MVWQGRFLSTPSLLKPPGLVLLADKGIQLITQPKKLEQTNKNKTKEIPKQKNLERNKQKNP